jgi:hypothetical protein
MEDTTNIESLKCVKCGARPVFLFQFSKQVKADRDKPFIRTEMAYTRTYYRRVVPTCKTCLQEFIEWNKLHKWYKVINWVGWFSFIIGLLFLLLTFLSSEDHPLRPVFLIMSIFGAGMLLFSFYYKNDIQRRPINPSNYLRYDSKLHLFEIRSQGDKQWQPYDLWVETTLSETDIS